MKNLLIVFSALFITGYVFTIAHAKTSPQIDEIDALPLRVEHYPLPKRMQPTNLYLI